MFLFRSLDSFDKKGSSNVSPKSSQNPSLIGSHVSNTNTNTKSLIQAETEKVNSPSEVAKTPEKKPEDSGFDIFSFFIPKL